MEMWLRAGIWRWCFVGWLLSVLVACGGGGGGEKSASVTLDRTSVTITAEQNATDNPGALIKATLHGVADSNVYLYAEATGVGVRAVEINVTSDTQAQAVVLPDTSLAPGTYSGTLYVYACLDTGCVRQLPGSPYKVAFTVTITPGLSMSPSPLAISGVSGVAASGTVTVVMPAGASTFTVDSSSLPSWLSLSGSTASSFTLQTGRVSSGYREAVVRGTTDTHRVGSVLVQYTATPPVGGEHNLVVNEGAVDLHADEGGSAQRTLHVQAPTWGPTLKTQTVYSLGSKATWLSVSPVSGGYALVASAAGLAQGVYIAGVTISGDSDTVAQNVNVTLTVGPGWVQVSDRTLTVDASTTASTLVGSAQVRRGDGAALAYTASSNAAWLTLDTTQGTTGDTLSFHTTRAVVADMPNLSRQEAIVTLRANGVPTPMQFKVVLDKALPQPTTVMPSVRLADVAGQQVVVRGRGFAAIADLAKQVSVGGLTGVTVRRVNDTELVLTLPATAQGSYPVTLSNALGLGTGGVPVRVVAPRSAVKGDVAQDGIKAAAVYDPLRNALLVLNRSTGTVERYALSAGQWQRTARSLVDPQGLALTPDVGTLVVSTSSGTVLHLDPVSLATQTSVALGQPSWQHQSMGGTLPTSNDGKVWLNEGNPGGWSLLRWYAPQTQTSDRPDFGNITTMFYGGPWGVASGNGERVLLNQTLSLSPTQPMLYMDAKDGVWHTTPRSDWLTFGQASLSEDGGRVALDHAVVLDGDFATVGQVELPSGAYPVASVLSANGQRLYLLTNADNFAAGSDNTQTVWVVDARAAAAGGLKLPVLGGFSLHRSSTCLPAPFDTSSPCFLPPMMHLSQDESMLFVAGYSAVVMQPVPDRVKQFSTAGVRQVQSLTPGAQRLSGIKRWAVGAR